MNGFLFVDASEKKESPKAARAADTDGRGLGTALVALPGVAAGLPARRFEGRAAPGRDRRRPGWPVVPANALTRRRDFRFSGI